MRSLIISKTFPNCRDKILVRLEQSINQLFFSLEAPLKLVIKNTSFYGFPWWSVGKVYAGENKSLQKDNVSVGF